MIQLSRLSRQALVLATAAAGLALAGCSVNADGGLTVGNHAESSKVSSKADSSKTASDSASDSSPSNDDADTSASADSASSTDSDNAENSASTGSSSTESDGAEASSTESTQTPANSLQAAVAALAQRGLTANDQTEVDVVTLPGAVKATDGISFHSDSGFRLTLLQFAAGSDCQAARTYYARANQKV
ncbi:hypothetical protein [Lacticaseibacillus kribbianus]|uniref:hypothetical protein n=1 Tax=Lacticaseibacillus kribbianus TaxID=2926292 RepID=UPI001CD76E51|nr:hypothetical protein [Lacticaseibacillus kribbianus]